MNQIEANEHYQSILTAIGAGLEGVLKAQSKENAAISATTDATLITNMTNASANLAGQVNTLLAAQQSLAFATVPLSSNTQYVKTIPTTYVYPPLPATQIFTVPAVPAIAVPNPPAYSAPGVVP